MSRPPTTPLRPAPTALARNWLGEAPLEISPLPGSGFSGAAVFAVHSPRGTFVLKAFADGTSPERAAWVHRLSRQLHDAGIDEIAPPLPTQAGTTLTIDAAGRPWELVPFVAGRPTSAPTAAQARAALQTLARVHRIAAAAPSSGPRGTATALVRRVARARMLLATPWEVRRAGCHAAAGPLAVGVRSRLDTAIAMFAAADGPRALAGLAGLEPADLPAQPVLRDLWADHVLFAPAPPERVAGFIDLHAAGIDSPATDIARLCGSWSCPWPGGGDEGWRPALAAYEAVRPLAAAERAAIAPLRASTIVFGLDNWFRWVLEDGRTFPESSALARVDRLLGLLPEALRELARIVSDGRFRPV